MASERRNPCELARDFPIFADLDEVSASALLSRGTIQHYHKGQPLFDEGDACRGLFLIQSGAVKIYKLSESGREQILAILRAGDSVAELPLFDRAPYPASAAALEPNTILFIPLHRFDAEMERNPRLALAIIRTLARRMRTLVDLIADLSLRQVRQRLARLLLEESGGRAEFRLEFTNEELAARLGSVRDVISRTLSGLQNDGLIRVQGRRISLLDPDALREEAG